MSSELLTVAVPENLLTRIRDRARQANRTVEAEVLDVLAGAIPGTDELSPDLRAALDTLDLLDDAALRRAFDSRLSVEASAELEALTFKERRAGLTPADESRRRDLIRQYERAMLVRARAAALLRQRGHEVPAVA